MAPLVLPRPKWTKEKRAPITHLAARLAGVEMGAATGSHREWTVCWNRQSRGKLTEAGLHWGIRRGAYSGGGGGGGGSSSSLNHQVTRVAVISKGMDTGHVNAMK